MFWYKDFQEILKYYTKILLESEFKTVGAYVSH